MFSSSFTLGRTQNSDVQMISVILTLTWLNTALPHLAISNLLDISQHTYAHIVTWPTT